MEASERDGGEGVMWEGYQQFSLEEGVGNSFYREEEQSKQCT